MILQLGNGPFGLAGLSGPNDLGHRCPNCGYAPNVFPSWASGNVYASSLGNFMANASQYAAIGMGMMLRNTGAPDPATCRAESLARMGIHEIDRDSPARAPQ